MGNCVSVSIPLDQSVNRVSRWLAEEGGYTHNLKKNLVALERTMVELKAKRDDLLRRLKREEDRGLQKLEEFRVWLDRVEIIEKEVNALLNDRDVELQRLCLCGLSSYCYGKKVFLMLREVEKLKTRVFEVIAEKALPTEVEEQQLIAKNLEALTTTMEELKAKRDDLLRRLEREEDRGLQRIAQFQVWLDRIETVQSRVNPLLNVRDVQLQGLSLSGFCSSLMSSLCYGKSVILRLKEVEKLKSEVFQVIAERALTFEVEEKQVQPTIVGQETMLDKAWNHLMEDGVCIMGMYGMGGVGKTTLLTQINNKFSNERSGFDFVIWVVVSKELHIEKIQDEIAQKVGLGGEEWKEKEKNQKVDVLYNFLRKKRFMLFLDDIWEKVDLAEIGVPFPSTQEGCKLAFTTRSLNVCTSMGVGKPMEVQCLSDSDAFDLFQKKVGHITLESDPEIPDLAKIVARKCSGLPLALNVIGETMSCKRRIQEWRHAIDILNSYAAEFSGMEDKILPLLKYSYDSLKGEDLKSCLLYCALFPEDARIPKVKLIEFWICEKIIDGSDGIERAENKGFDIIGSLVGASLLMEEVDRDGKDVVCMHDVVREMALWIASDLGKQKEAFIVRAGVGLSEIPKVKNWNVVTRMSLMNNKIINLAGSPDCIKLTTLLLQEASLKYISSEFFKSMPKLAVLDLSGNYLFELPEEISELVSLQYLNLSGAGIRHLPKGLQELKKLIYLDLENTYNLAKIAGISSLHNLKVLKLAYSFLRWDLDTVKELESLEHLEYSTTSLCSPITLMIFLSSHRLLSRTQFLVISKIINMKSSGITIPVPMDKLREFSIRGCSSISEIQMGRICSFLSLVQVHVRDCECLKELTFLMFCPNLRTLVVQAVYELEDIINKDKAWEGEGSSIVPFPKLKNLYIDGLPELKNIYWTALPFPCLKEIEVTGCPNLKKLPLDSKSGKQGENGLVIKYKEKEWIEGVEWEDEATKSRFLLSCRELSETHSLRP